MAFSILRATSVSSNAGAAPGRLATTRTLGRSMSMNCWTFIAMNDSVPMKASRANSRIAGMGLRIDQAETFISRRASL